MRKQWLVLGLILSVIQCCVAQNKPDKMKDLTYEKAWETIAEHEGNGLPESAMVVVNQVYAKAKAEGNAGQLAKALIFKLKFIDAKEEKAFVKNLVTLKSEADAAKHPLKPLLHSMLAELYWQYYQGNRYEFINRSATVNVADDDVETWSLSKIVSETFRQYELSLDDAEKSKTESVDLFQPVIAGGNFLGKQFRPTLYDFLAGRALDFYSGDEPALTNPAYRFTLDKPEYFSDAKDFVNVKIETKDTTSMKLRAILIMQDLIRLHLNDKDPAALVDIDLRRLKFVRAHSTVPEKEPLYFQAIERLEKQMLNNPVVGKITYEKASIYMQTAMQYAPLVSENHKWDLRTAYQLCEEAKKRFPESDGAVMCDNLQVSLRYKSLSAVIEENNVPNQPFRSLVHYKNISDIHYRVIKVSRAEVRALRMKLNNDYTGDRETKFIKYFLSKPSVKTGAYKLPDDGDYQQHAIEIKIDGVPEGEYIVVLSHTASFSIDGNGMCYAFTVVTNISYTHRTMDDGSTEFYVLNRTSGEPIKGVTATLYTQSYNNSKGRYESVKGKSFLTDANGFFRIPFGKDDDRQSFGVDFTKGNDFVSTENLDRGEYYYSASIYQQQQVNPTISRHTFFFLDRAIYRPGQTIYFKGLVVDTDGKNPKIIPGYTTTVTLYDVNHQEKGTLSLTTNEFGTFNGVFTAPSSGLTGEMTISNQDGSGDAGFSVEEYKRPKFEVGFNPVLAAFRLNDHVTVEGHAQAYSGANIDGAMVKYRVVRTANFPFWYWSRWRNYPTSPSMEIINGVATSDADGKFKIDFQAIPDLSISKDSDPTFNYEITADVTDINGETHSSTTTISVGYKSLLVSVVIDNINKDARDLKTEFNISTINLAGQFQAAKGKISIFSLKAPAKAYRARTWAEPDRKLYSEEQYHSYFPKDLYDDESNKYKWARDKEVFSSGFDTGNAKTIQLTDLSKWPVGEYVLEISATDKDGQPVKEIKYFTVYAPSGKTIPAPAVEYYQPVKIVAEPGEKAAVAFGTSEDAVRALYEVEHDGKIVSSEWVTLNKEQRIFEVPVKEEYRGNIAVHFTFIKDNRLYAESINITVPYSNKQLDITFESFRDKLLPGAKEQWKLRIKGKNADKIVAEMVATMYDASLDEFRANGWYAYFYNSAYARLNWESTNGFRNADATLYARTWLNEVMHHVETPEFEYLNWFNYNFYQFTRRGRMYKYEAVAASPMAKKAEISSELEESVSMDRAKESFGGAKDRDQEKPGTSTKPAAEKKEDMSDVKVRTNFNETAFFFPTLQTNENGEITINFTIPEALTRWKMLGFAHTKDLKSGYAYNQLVTQKDIMVVPNQPRFFRENDRMKFSAKVSSLVDKELTGQAQLQFFDALTMKPIDDLMKNQKTLQSFSLKPKQSANLEWSIEIPEGIQAITYRIVAKAGDFSDGEEMVLPVVTNRMLLTETLPLPIRGKQTKEFRFEKLLNNKSTTLRHQRYTLEFTSNPAWYAIQALPYLMEYPYDCVEQTFSKYYANSIASHIANSNPRIKQVFDTWKNIQPDALLSNLEKNQELKSALLEETPWVLQAKDESQRKRMIGVLFDLNRMAAELDRAIEKVKKAQLSSGGFTWFPGFPEDRYMTQHIVAGMGHLDVMGVKSVRDDDRTLQMTQRAISYMDAQIKHDYDLLVAAAKRKEIKLEDNHIGYIQYHYLYTRSYFKDIAVNAASKEAFDYFLGQAKKYWLSTNSLYMQGMICLSLNRFGDKSVTAAMIKSFSERALHSEEMGMYWKYDVGYYWWQAPIETQALMIEVYDEVAGDTKSVEDLKAWLLKQKQTQDWQTTKATVEACYALLRRGTDVLSSTKQVEIKVGKQIIDPSKLEGVKTEAGTGYFKTAWQASDIKPEMGKITLTKTDDGVAWGAVYWQYFEQLDKITPAETPLKLKKDLFVKLNTDRGPVISPVNDKSVFHVGDLVKVRIELRVDRDMEYVHLKDMRAAGFEPVSTLSTFKYQDGLYYYESPKDLATNFFMGSLRKGTYVFEYDLRVSQKGNFSNGVTTIQCMYAPEFSSHSNGIRVEIE